MDGIAQALASVLYPNSGANSMYSIAGKSIASQPMVDFKNPWANALAGAVQPLLGAGLQAYGQYAANKANAENAAQMVPQLGKLGVSVTPEMQEGLLSSDPQKRALALALAEKQVGTADAIRKNETEFQDFARRKVFEKALTDADKQGELDKQKLALEQQLRGSVEGQTLKDFQQTDRYFKAMIDASTKNDKISDISMISNLAKLRDPSSVVREGEYKVSADVDSWLNNQFGNVRAAVEGNAKLSAETRAKMLGAAQDYWNSARDTYGSLAGKYEELAQRKGISPSDVVLVPWRPEAYSDFLKTIPDEQRIRAAFDQQINQQQLGAIAGRMPTIATATTQAPETTQGLALPPLGPDMEYKQVGPNTYIRVLKGK